MCLFKAKASFSSFSVDNLDKAKDFYGQVLGIEVTEEEMGVLFLHTSGTKVLVYPKKNHEPATFTVLNFEVDDIDRAAAELADKGINLERYDGFNQDEKGIARSSGEGPSVAWFKDPAGNILSVIQEE